MSKKLLICLIWTIATTSTVFSQMNIDGTIKYGHEWINYDKTYYKIKLAEDGIYRLSAAELIAAGVPLAEVSGEDLQLYHFGEQVPIRVSTDGQLGDQDYIDFYGLKNRGELDAHIYEEPDIKQLNPDYSLITDTSSYFLTWESGTNARFTELQNDLTGNLPEAEEYYWAVEEQIFSNYHHKPVRNEARFTSLDIGEGFGSDLLNENSFNFNPSNVFTSGPKAIADIRFATNLISHIPEFSVGGQAIKRDTFSDYDLKYFEEEIDLSLLESNTTISLVGKASEGDRYIVSRVGITYPRSFSFDNESELKLSIPANGQEQYIEIENYDSQIISPTIFDVEASILINGTVDGGVLKFLLPASQNDREILITHESQFKSTGKLEATEFRDLTDLDPQYIILTGKKLYNDNTIGENVVESYATYRRSAEGGSFDVEVIFADELYDQFGYGVERHAIAIRNFSQYIESRWNSAEYMFILGKALEYNIYRTPEQIVEQERQNFNVPTFGSPGSDNLLFAPQGSSVPILPVGRIAARSVGDVRLYLDKVIVHENPLSTNQTLEDQIWKKRVIHLSGGIGAVLQRVIFELLDSMANVIGAGNIGGKTATFRKTSSDAVQTSTSTEITNRITEGASIITFFGHASKGVFDFSIDQPEDFNNYGKYPLIISLGCLSGDIHSVVKSLSINYVLEADRAAIAFLASSGNAYVGPSYDSGLDIYQSLSGDMYGETIGKVILESLQKRDANKRLETRSLNEQLTLHGDPALRLHEAIEGPDMIVDFESVQTEPAIVSTNLDSFDIKFDVYNLGKSLEAITKIEVRHLSPSGELLFADTMDVSVPGFSSAISTKFPIPSVSATGKNSIEINLDINNSIAEFPDPEAESNNSLKSIDGGEQPFCFYILDTGASPVYPTQYSIVTTNDLVLKASTSNGFLEVQKFIIQIDTTELFNSPLLEQGEVRQGGGLIEWKPSIALEEERVYYWRISPETTIAREGFLWQNSSFVYLPNGQNGWNQSHYFQSLSAEFDGLDLPQDRQLQFDTAGFNISIFNKNYLSDRERGLQFNFETFANSVRPWGSMPEGGLAVVWGDAITGNFKRNENGQYNSLNTGRPRYFGYKTQEAEGRRDLINLITNEIPDGSFVYIIAVANDEDSSYGPELWNEDQATLGTTLFDIFENEGATQVRDLETLGSVPYNFVYVKGEGGDTAEGLADSTGFIKTDYFVTNNGTEGSMRSTTIGPAKSWDKLLWDESSNEENDVSTMKLFGIDKNGIETELVTSIPSKEFDLTNIDAGQYPYLRLEYSAKDETDRTSPVLDYWRVQFEELPEAALNPQALLSFQADTLEQGQDLVFQIAVDNISNTDMDSLLVNYKLLNAANNETIVENRLEPLPKNGRLTASYQRSTLELNGNYQFSVEINPDEDQPEQFDFNNFAIKEFYVKGDTKNPLLDVTFDGVHILDGDIVSPKPCILIELNDDNKYLPINNISAFDISLLYPGQSQATIIPLSDPNLKFTPADGDNNRATLEYKPDLDEGMYKLFVQGKDATGNDSAKKKYEATFEVVKAREITNVLNYPNPFSTSTQFVFTLTGEVPDVFTIRIMTLSGKVVKEITKEELGEIRLGVNKTKYRWNGRDDYGNQLGNGVYLYKVIMSSNTGEDYEKRFNGTDQYFTQGIGKMVLLR